MTVKINENTLYDVETTLCILVHELAHNTGNLVRCRVTRKKIIFDVLLRRILNYCDIDDKGTTDVLNSYVNKYFINDNKDGYLQELDRRGTELLFSLVNDQDGKLWEEFKLYYSKKDKASDDKDNEILFMLGIEDSKSQESYKDLFENQYSDQKYKIFKKQIQKMSISKNIKGYIALTHLLERIYRECYADLQMILVLSVTLEEYMNIIIRKHNVLPEDLFYETEDAIRFSIVIKVLFYCEIWNMGMLHDSEMKNIVELILHYCEQAYMYVPENEKEQNEKIREQMNDSIRWYKKEMYSEKVDEKAKNKSGKDRYAPLTFSKEAINEEIVQLKYYGQIAYGLYNYLLNVMKEALKEYQREDKKVKIRAIRQVTKTILEFDDTINVFDCIEKELNNYQKALFEGA